MATRKKSGRSAPKSGSKRSSDQSSKIKNLHEALLLKMQALLDVENELVKALPKMAKKAADPKLKAGFEKHLKQTEQHAERLERAFESLGEKAKKVKVEAIRGLVKDAEWTMKNAKTDEARDASMIAAGQYVEHYEIAGYGTAIEWAKLMQHSEVQDLLEQTLQEEKDTDMELNELAVAGGINERAVETSGSNS